AAHALDVVGAPDRPDPLDADAAHRVLDLVSGTAGAVLGARRRNVLAAGRRGVVVLDHDGDVVALVEHGIGDAAGEPVVPETAVAHDADRALASGHVQRAGRGRAEAVAHRRVPDVERRPDREQVAADVGADVVLAELALEQLPRGGFRGPPAAGARPGRPGAHVRVRRP